MTINFIYSLLQEVKEAINIITHKSEYENLRSVVWPTPLKILKFFFSSNKSIKRTGEIWSKSSGKIIKAFSDHKLGDLGRVSCYIHSISCEGWFDTDNNSIHVRVVNDGGDKELVNTIIHELIHLATYSKTLSYEEREDVVDKYLEMPDFKNIVS